MSTVPVASVLVPVLNGEAHIGNLLSALSHQAGVGQFEIIVVDNGSTDGTIEVARSHGATVLQQPIRGPSAARNMGLRHARADIIACADSDTIPPRRWLASLLSAFADPKVNIATGPILGWKPTTAPERFSSARASFTRKNTVDNPSFPYALGMNTAVRRKNALAIGGWDELMTSGEDVDFCYRMKLQFGNPIRWVEEAILFHQHRCSDAAFEKQARWHGAGQALFMRRHADRVRWTTWNSLMIHVTNSMLEASRPLVALGRASRLMSAQRVEFEQYYRLWHRYFWSGFFDEWRKRSA